MEKIFFSNYPVSCIVGILPRERRVRQQLLLSISVEGRFPARFSGNIKDTLDYFWLAKTLDCTLRVGRFRILEVAAQAIAEVAYFYGAMTSSQTNIEKIEVRLVKTSVFKPKSCEVGVNLEESYANRPKIPDKQALVQVYDGPDCGIFGLKVESLDSTIVPVMDTSTNLQIFSANTGVEVNQKQISPWHIKRLANTPTQINSTNSDHPSLLFLIQQKY